LVFLKSYFLKLIIYKFLPYTIFIYFNILYQMILVMLNKLGRDKIKHDVWKDDIEEQLARDKLKINFIEVKFDQKYRKLGYKKNRRFVIFRAPFLTILSKMAPIRIYRKTGPTKSTVLGPRPPPEILLKFIEFYRFLMILGPSIEPEKPSVKSASTPYPP
jgi:hypothetical protein